MNLGLVLLREGEVCHPHSPRHPNCWSRSWRETISWLYGVKFRMKSNILVKGKLTGGRGLEPAKFWGFSFASRPVSSSTILTRPSIRTLAWTTWSLCSIDFLRCSHSSFSASWLSCSRSSRTWFDSPRYICPRRETNFLSLDRDSRDYTTAHGTILHSWLDHHRGPYHWNCCECMSTFWVSVGLQPLKGSNLRGRTTIWSLTCYFWPH